MVSSHFQVWLILTPSETSPLALSPAPIINKMIKGQSHKNIGFFDLSYFTN